MKKGRKLTKKDKELYQSMKGDKVKMTHQFLTKTSTMKKML